MLLDGPPTARTSRRCLAGAFAAIAAALAACGQAPGLPASNSGSAATNTRAAQPGSRPATPSASATTQPLTLAFVGDMNFEYEIRSRLEADPNAVFGASRPLLAAADLTFGNLETSITERGAPEPKEYTFRAPATAFDALEAAGFDAVSMANNHGVDFGAEGLTDTLTAIGQTDVAVAGIGADANAAYAPVFLEAQGRRVAFLAALQLEDHTWRTWGATDTSPGVARYDQRFVDSVRAADAAADVTIAYLHWAPENEICPDPAVAPPIVDALTEAGADIVIGAHAHRLQGAGWRDRVFVSYGLGNYLWYVQLSEESTRTGIVTVTLDAANDPIAFDYAPARIQEPTGDPQPLAGAEAAEAEKAFEELRSCTDLTPAPPPPAAPDAAVVPPAAVG